MRFAETLRDWASPLRGTFDPSSPRQLKAFLARFGDVSATAGATGRTLGTLIYHARPDIRAALPLALTPHQREAYAAWLFEHGRRDLGIRDGEIIAYLLAACRDPSHGLRDTWLLQPEWQQSFPDAFDRRGWPRFIAALATRFGIAAPWLRRARRPQIKQQAVPGVNLLAHFRYPSGLQEEAVQYAAALEAHGWSVSLRDAPLGFSRCFANQNYLGPECHDITLMKLGACESPDEAYTRTGWHPRPGVHRIACWSWELETFPRHLAGSAKLVDEIWAPSEFCANALRAAFPAKPVHAMLPGVSLPAFEPRPRSFFDLPDGFLFLFAFDMNSVMERKNPLGLIAAFRRAFPAAAGVHLAIKVNRGGNQPHSLARLKSAAGGGVSIIDRDLSRADYLSLVNCCDAYVSLHRAEGFGYTIAEAMLLGKPVIATGYSANREFMPPGAGLLVRHRMAAVGPDCEPYPAESLWAEPDLEQAADFMRSLVDQPDLRRQLGQNGHSTATSLLSPQAAGARIVRRLAEIRTRRAIAA